MPALSATAGGVHVPKTEVEARHKVVRFGTLYTGETDEEDQLYTYLHQRADLKVSRGIIPVGFLSCITLPEGHPLYLETREGGFDERDRPVGPLFNVSWKQEREVLGAGASDGWMSNLDDLWTSVLSHFERKNLLLEETLDYLDADPFVLFGIDDMVTQQALRKLEKYPALMCEGSVPNFEEWSYYLRIDPEDNKLRWLVQAFSETDLPKPWTCYKGVGSIVCYIHSTSGQVTWKHPFYDYFRQLRDFCRKATKEEVMQVRCTRLLWSYEATRVETEHDQEPLVSPEYIGRMASIFGYNIKTEGFLVRNLKAQLKVFARTYRTSQEIHIADVVACAELLVRDCEKHAEMKQHWEHNADAETHFELSHLANGEIQCVNCGTIALAFCLECKDYLCLTCYTALHSKGARLTHAPFRLVACSLCITMPAKLHCTFTDKALCHECYAMKHIKMLPADGKENQPRRIDYFEQYTRYAKFASDRTALALPSFGDPSMDEQDTYESVLSTDWHPFYDARGVKYYHNFVTGERMRQSPRRVPNTEDPGAGEGITGGVLANIASSPGPSLGGTRTGFSPTGTGTSGGLNAMNQTAPPALTGFDSLKTEPSAVASAAQQPQIRNLRAPHRTHMPQEVPAL